MNVLTLSLLALGASTATASSFVDKNYRSFADFVDLVDEAPETLSSSSDFNDTYKLSHGNGAKVSNKHIVNRNEDCIDMVRVTNAIFTNIVLEPFGKNGITVKGASTNIFVSAEFLRHGSVCDLEIGQFDNYWYPGRPPSEVTVALVSADGKPAKVRLWDGELAPSHFSPRAEVTRIPKVIWYPYFLFRYTQLRVTNFLIRLSGGTSVKTS